MSETRAQYLARIASDNAIAATVLVGTVAETFFGETVLEGPVGETTPDGWDLYSVRHSGLLHDWSSAEIRAAFTKEA